jgi:hypothetical protein
MSFCEEYGKKCACMDCKSVCVEDPCSPNHCDGIHTKPCKMERGATLLEDVLE